MTRGSNTRSVRVLATLVTLFMVGSAGARESAGQEPKNSPDALPRAVVQAVCPNHVRTEILKNGTAYGCGGCPEFTSFKGETFARGNAPDFEIRKTLQGSFSRPGANEVLAYFNGCEPHSDNFGGTMVLEQADSRLKYTRWVPGPIGLVRTYRRSDGSDLVLSQGGYTGQGESTYWVSTLDFSKPDPTAQTLLTVEDDTGNACMLDQVNIGYISGLEFPDVNGDGRPDLRLKVKAGKAKVPAKFRQDCVEDFRTPDVPTYTIDFVFDGKSFHVTPSTAAALRQVKAQSE